MSRGHCDGHGTERSDVRSCGQDANGAADAPDLCFLCRKESQRGRFYDQKLECYVRQGYGWWQVRTEAKVSVEAQCAQTKVKATKKQVKEAVAHFGSHMSLKQQREMVNDLWNVING